MSEAKPSPHSLPIEELLSRPLSESQLASNTAIVARTALPTQADGETLLFFASHGELFALPASSVVRAFAPLPIHQVPHRPGPIFRGVASDHGDLRLVASLEAALDLGPWEGAATETTRRMLLVSHGSEQWLMEVDAVLGIHRCARERWSPPPATLSHARGAATVALVPLGSRRAALLDPAKLVHRFRDGIS